MKNDEPMPLRPFLSVFIVIATLLSIVIIQIEERRLGYAILQLTREHKLHLEEKRSLSIELAQMTRPQYVSDLAQQNLDLRRVNAAQIIHMTSSQY